MGIFAWIVVGAIAGYVATLIVGDREGLILTIALGIGGGILGGYVAANVFHFGTMDGINIESIVIAIAGSLAVIATWNFLMARGGRRSHLL
jgi:uncharacterized membrane protein YeaQ/YmgE (transglycosylase-associated protein family)